MIVEKNRINEMVKLDLLLDSNGYLSIADNINGIRIDVGLSYSAPNSALWLLSNNDIMVYGFEPDIRSINELKEGNRRFQNQPYIKIEDESVMLYDKKLLNYNGRFKLLEFGLSNVSGLENREFYYTSEGGCSSLFKPTTVLPYKTVNIGTVPILPLSHFFSYIPWHRFPFIELVKIDAQGSDYDILLGMEEYINRIALIYVENSTFGEYESTPRQEDMFCYLRQNNFEIVENTRTDSLWRNKELKNESEKINYQVVQ